MHRIFILICALLGLLFAGPRSVEAGVTGGDSLASGDACGVAMLPFYRPGVVRGRLFDDDGHALGQFMVRLWPDGMAVGHAWTVWGRGPVIGVWESSPDDEEEFEVEAFLPGFELEIEGEWEGFRNHWIGEWELAEFDD